MPRLEAEDATYPIMKHDFKWAKILEIDYETDTCNIVIVDKDKVETSETYEDVPIFYHCFPDVKKRDNGALEGASSAFARNDFVLVRFEDGNPIVVARLDGLMPCLDVVLWGDKAYGMPNLYTIYDKSFCSKIQGCPKNSFVYFFSNTFKFDNHSITIIQSFSIKIAIYEALVGAGYKPGGDVFMQYLTIVGVDSLSRRLSILTESGFIVIGSSDGYWLDYNNKHICVIKRGFDPNVGKSTISFVRYSSDGTFVNEDKTIYATDYEFEESGRGRWDLTDYYLLCDKNGNVYAINKYDRKNYSFASTFYYKATWNDFPENLEKIEVEKDYLKITEQDIYQHDLIISDKPNIVEDRKSAQFP